MTTPDNEPSLSGIRRDAPTPELVKAAAVLVNTGALPREDSARILAGPGEGRPCALCADAIEATDVEYELAPGSASSYRFHIPCYFAWKRAAESANGGSGDG
jgi:hypothetical protein